MIFFKQYYSMLTLCKTSDRVLLVILRQVVVEQAQFLSKYFL